MYNRKEDEGPLISARHQLIIEAYVVIVKLLAQAHLFSEFISLGKPLSRKVTNGNNRLRFSILFSPCANNPEIEVVTNFGMLHEPLSLRMITNLFCRCFVGSNAYQYRHRADAIGLGTGIRWCSSANGRIKDTAGSGEYAEFREQVREVRLPQLLLQAQYTNADRYVGPLIYVGSCLGHRVHQMFLELSVDLVLEHWKLCLSILWYI